MPFRFLKYLQPVHYFRLNKENRETVFPTFEGLPADLLSKLDIDLEYTTEQAQHYDASWQAVKRGYIGNAPIYKSFESLSLIDEYRFARKNFHKFWITYVFGLRLLSLKNPIKETQAFFMTRHVRRLVPASKEVVKYPKYDQFESPLVGSNPLVSIIIPTLNRYTYLKDVLLDLEKQTYTNFEVIVVDQSNPFDANFYKSFDLNMNLMHQEEMALWLARNTAVRESKGNFILLFDDDSRVDTNWIFEHLKTLDYFQCDLSSGVSISVLGAEIPEDYSFFRLSDQLDTGNVLVRKNVFKAIGLFDRQFEKQRMGDGEFGLRAYRHGFLNISNPNAKRLHLKVGSGGLREMGSWDAFRTKNIFSPRPIPSVLYFYRTYFGTKPSIYAMLKTIPISLVPFKFKGNKKMLIFGFIMLIVLFPIIGFQAARSWYSSGKKLHEGSKIEWL